jgi:putative ABC transport system substrate-binding protein
MRRREFITLLGGTMAAWPLASRAQQREQMRRIGVLMNLAADDSEASARVGAFAQGLAESGWTIGGNVRIEYRWGAGNADNERKYAAELLALTPDVIVASGSLAVMAFQRLTRTVPIVFTLISDPIGAGFVDSLARPGGNTTGFMIFEYSMGGKWLELLKEIAPSITRVAVVRDAANPAGSAQFGAIRALAQSLGVEVSAVNVSDSDEIERAIALFARSANGGLVVTGSAMATVHHTLIISLAARHKLPAVYTNRFNVAEGGLISYGPDRVAQYGRAAAYVGRVLKGAKPADLPVQAPTKYELVINLKTAKGLGIEVSPTLLARANEVIE